MPADMIRSSVQPSGAMASVSPAGSAAQAAPKSRPAAAPAVAAAAVPVRPAWPDPATINLAGELLELSTTTIAHTGTLTLPDTGGDFWALLAAALGEGRRG